MTGFIKRAFDHHAIKYGWVPPPEIDILFVNHEESLTGAPAILLSIAKHFKKKLKPGRLRVLSRRKGDAHGRFKAEFDMIYPRDFYPRRLYPRLTPYQLAKKFLKLYRPKLVYANCVDSHEYVRAARALGIPVILHAHELRRGFYGNLKEGVFKEEGMVTHFADSADHFICPSQEVYDLMVKSYGVRPAQLDLVHEFIDTDAVRRQSLGKCGKGLHEPLVVACGVGEDRKGVDRFVEVARQMPEINFVWIGKLYIYLGAIPKNVYFTDAVQNPFPLMKKADVFVLMSKEDPFPLVVLEAMALGRPVITLRDSGGSHHAVGEAGVVMEKMDVPEMKKQIRRLLDHPALRKELGEKAMARVEREFGVNAGIQKIEKIVERFL